MSGPKKYLRTESGERIDQPDFEHAAEESQLAGLTQLGETFIVGSDAGQKSYVLSGFEVTSPSASTIQIGAGSGILSWRDQGNVEHGVIFEMADAVTYGLSGTLSGSGSTFGVYVAFDLQDTQNENRNFWNALAATPVEVTRQIATRRVDSIKVTITASTSTPGTGEWMHVADLVPHPTMAITDKRVFYFEGAVADSYDPTADWGGGTDRNVDRATYGLKGLRQFVRATQSQLFNIISPIGGGWYEDPTTLPTSTETGATQGLSLAYAKSEALSRLGDAAVRLGKRMSGNLIVSASNAYSIGEQATPWADIHSGSIWLGLARQAAALADDPRIVVQAATGLMTKVLSSTLGGVTPNESSIEFIHLPATADASYPGGLDGSFAIASNCIYDNTAGALPTNAWGRYDNAHDSYLFEFGTGAGGAAGNVGFRIFYHNSASNNVWDNTPAGGAAAWTNYLTIGAGSSGNGSVYGSFTANNLLSTSWAEVGATAPSGTALQPAGNLAARIYRSSLVRASGRITTTGGGTAFLDNQQGVASIAAPTVSTIDVTLADSYQTGLNAIPLVSFDQQFSAGTIAAYFTSPTVVRIEQTGLAGGFTTGTYSINFMIIGNIA
ncbi:MAG: hypothetical protein CME17_06870 [Gemmatimonadetes bacterium]|nr:hypothetical protein [Gemmatimonadota bacterium]|tara:strand:- start:2475 stop:4304 length:1830 start_codon:yes stop_codon:yes gene_type:complete